MSAIAEFLKQCDIFYQFTPTQLELVASLCREATFRNGEEIFHEGSNNKELYIIVEGEVEILLNPALVGGPTSAAQADARIAVLRRGQSFGEIALVDEGVRSATARAIGRENRLLVIPRDRLLMLCETYPHLGYRLMYNLAADLAMKIRNTDLRIREQLLYRAR